MSEARRSAAGSARRRSLRFANLGRHGRGTNFTALAFAVCLGWCPRDARGEDAEASIPPPFRPLRYDEDYGYLADRSKRLERIDALKYVPLGSGPAYVSFGGEIRERYEYFHNPLWGAGTQDPGGYVMSRFMLHGDVHLDDTVRVFTQFKSCLLSGRAGDPRPTDVDRLDLHQAFLELGSAGDGANAFGVRLGRQELQYGSSRLISAREGPNARRSFDAAKAMLRVREWKVDAFGGRPVTTDPGAWDDEGDESQAFWGVYATGPAKVLPDGHVDVYYLGLDRQDAEFEDGVGRERRHSVGVRAFGSPGPWDYDIEAVWQFGDFAGGPIRAWTVASDLGYSPPAIPEVRLGLKVDVASGDKAPGDGLQTFNALFPRGSYFGEPALLGPANFFDVHPSIERELREGLRVYADWDFFWRQSLGDGLYGTATNLLRSGAGSGRRFVGSQIQVGVEWDVDRHVTVNAAYAHFFASRFLEETGPGEDVDYVSVWVTLKF
jgi:hypothetical protein